MMTMITKIAKDTLKIMKVKNIMITKGMVIIVTTIMTMTMIMIIMDMTIMITVMVIDRVSIKEVTVKRDQKVSACRQQFFMLYVIIFLFS